jgi:hypothetical protein
MSAMATRRRARPGGAAFSFIGPLTGQPDRGDRRFVLD